MPPPLPLALLPERVLLRIVAVALTSLRIPPPCSAELSEMVLFSIVSLPPALLKMPPPLLGVELPVMTQLLSVSAPLF
jgi:hypothetical protein